MSFWNRLQGYASEFVKSIDDGFANKNQQEMASEDKTLINQDISDNDIIRLENEQEDSKTTEKEINPNSIETESKNQNDSNLDEKLENSKKSKNRN